MAKKLKRDLLFGEVYAYNDGQCKTWFGIPLRDTGKDFEFSTAMGIMRGTADHCTRVWDKETIKMAKERIKSYECSKL
jgi:hypothetical protein